MRRALTQSQTCAIDATLKANETNISLGRLIGEGGERIMHVRVIRGKGQGGGVTKSRIQGGVVPD